MLRTFGGRCGPLIDPRPLFEHFVYFLLFKSLILPAERRSQKRQKNNEGTCGPLIDPQICNISFLPFLIVNWRNNDKNGRICGGNWPHSHPYIYIYIYGNALGSSVTIYISISIYLYIYIYTQIQVYIYIYALSGLKGPHFGLSRVNKWAAVGSISGPHLFSPHKNSGFRGFLFSTFSERGSKVSVAF